MKLMYFFQHMGTNRKVNRMGSFGVKLVLMTACAVAVILAWDSSAQALNPRPICEICRRYTDKSPSRIIAFIEIGKHVKKLDACSIFCLVEMLEEERYEPTVIYVANYDTFGTDEHMPLNAEQGYYLFDCDSGDEQKVNEPYTYAFASEETARQYQEELGGELMDWEELVIAVTVLTDEWEQQLSDYEYRPLRGKRQNKNDETNEEGN